MSSNNSKVTLTLYSDFHTFKKPVQILINRKKASTINEACFELQVAVDSEVQFKLDRLTGSSNIKFITSGSYDLSINKSLKYLTITAALLFFILSVLSMSNIAQAYTYEIFGLSLTSVMAVFLSFTLWKNKWITVSSRH